MQQSSMSPLSLIRITLFLSTLLTLASTFSADAREVQSFKNHNPEKILFVGNSITYTENLPAILFTIGKSQKLNRLETVDMFVRGGARINDLVSDSRLQEALRSGDYDTVILQEQGGLDACAGSDVSRSEEQCEQVIRAHVRLADLAGNSRIVYLGTYQPNEDASRRLLEGEAWLSQKIGATHIPISLLWRELSAQMPSLPWMNRDKMHPGPALTVLMAIELYRAMAGEAPKAVAICTNVNLFTPNEALDGLINFAYLMSGVAKNNCILSEENVADLIRGISS